MPDISITRRKPDRSYWLSRQWVYQPFMVSGRSTESLTEGRILTASKGRSESSMPVDGPLAAPDLAVREVLTSGRVVAGNIFSYAGRQTSIRPTTRRLLNIMFAGGGRHISIASAARELWGRAAPPSANSLYMVVFRVNVALRVTQCPLKLCVRQIDLYFNVVQIE